MIAGGGDVDIVKALVFNKISFGEKKKTISTLLVTCMMVTPLNIMLPKTSAYVKRYNGQTKWMDFLIEDDDLMMS